MDYNAPFGSADPNAGFVDRNTPGAVAGSKVPALAIEMPQREIVTVIKNAGLTPSKNDPTQLDQAIDQKILAATGSGGDENYVLMTQARVRLPIFPEVLTADGRLPVVTPAAGQVRVPAGYEFLHRGIFLVTTEQADFATAANKIYHLRWSHTAGFALKDLADVAYNAGAVAEDNAAFDSRYDDILFSRVTTNGSNSATVLNLVNKASMSWKENQVRTDGIIGSGAPGYSYSRQMTFDHNFARAPMHASVVATLGAGVAGSTIGLDGHANLVRNIESTRYRTSFSIDTDFNGTPGSLFVDATVSVMG